MNKKFKKLMTILCTSLFVSSNFGSVVFADTVQTSKFSTNPIQMDIPNKTITIENGKSASIDVNLTPSVEYQTKTCGQPIEKCPSTCGEGCADENGWCTCGGHEYSPYNSEVKLSSADSSIATASYLNGKIIIEGKKAGTTTISAVGTLRKHNDTEAQAITVKVSNPNYDISGKNILPESTIFTGSGKVTLTAPEDADVYYTTTGENPDTSSTSIQKGTSTDITISKTTTVKAIAVKDGYNNSDVVSANYTVKTAAPSSAYIPNSSIFTGSSNVKLLAPSNTDLYYTTDGSIPTEKSSKIAAGTTEVLSITETTTVKATAVKAGALMSDVVTSTYKIIPAVVNDKSPKAEGITITPSSDITSEDPDSTEKVQVVITYDKPIKVASDAVKNFNIAMNGTTYPESSLKVYVDPSDSHKLVFDVMIGFAIMGGNLTITPANSEGITKVTNEDKSASVVWSDVNLYVPNGVKLETVSSTKADSSKKINASVTKKMTSQGKLRGMVHFLFLKNGQPVGELDSYGASVVAHYHDYVGLTAETFVPSIVNALKGKYGEDYTFTSDKDTFTVNANNSENGDVLDVRIFAYPQDRDADKTELNAEIEKTKVITAEGYTKESYDKLQEELAKAKALTNTNYDLQEEVDSAVNSLKEVASQLKTSNITKDNITEGTSFKNSGDITLKAPDSADLYYTIDGSNPSKSSNKVPAGTIKVINITKTTTVKAAALKADSNMSDIITETYTVTSFVVTEESPKSTGMTITPSSDITSEDPDSTEKVQVVITYDKPIKVASDAVKDFNIAMNGTTYPESSLKVYVDPSDSHKLVFDIMIGFALYGGNLTITPNNDAGISKVTNENGSSPIEFKDINLYVPNGVKLETVSSVTADSSKEVKASITKRMTSLGKLRGMVHFLFLKNGVPVGELDSYGASVVAHYHMYSTLTAETFVPLIVSSLNAKYGEDYTFTSDKDTFTATAKNSENGDVLDVRVFAYPQDRDADKTDLKAEIEKVNVVTAEGYTKESYDNLQTELTKAKTLTNTNYALQSEVDAAVNSLKTAVAALKKASSDDIKTIIDENTGITVKGSLPSAVSKLSVEPISDLSDFDESLSKVSSEVEKYKAVLAYDFSLLGENGAKVVFDGNGSAVVSIKLPENLLNKKLVVFYIDGEGTATKIDSSVSDGVITFTTTHFSKYVVAEVDKVTSDSKNNGNNEETNTGSDNEENNQGTESQTNNAGSTSTTISNVENPKTGNFEKTNFMILIMLIMALAGLVLVQIRKKRFN